MGASGYGGLKKGFERAAKQDSSWTPGFDKTKATADSAQQWKTDVEDGKTPPSGLTDAQRLKWSVDEVTIQGLNMRNRAMRRERGR